jgi:hypothetical protein
MNHEQRDSSFGGGRVGKQTLTVSIHAIDLKHLVLEKMPSPYSLIPDQGAASLLHCYLLSLWSQLRKLPGYCTATLPWRKSPAHSELSTQRLLLSTIFLLLLLLLLLCWGYIVAFTKVLTIYQIYHTWIHPLPSFSLFSLAPIPVIVCFSL